MSERCVCAFLPPAGTAAPVPAPPVPRTVPVPVEILSDQARHVYVGKLRRDFVVL